MFILCKSVAFSSGISYIKVLPKINPKWLDGTQTIVISFTSLTCVVARHGVSCLMEGTVFAAGRKLSENSGMKGTTRHKYATVWVMIQIGTYCECLWMNVPLVPSRLINWGCAFWALEESCKRNIKRNNNTKWTWYKQVTFLKKSPFTEFRAN